MAQDGAELWGGEEKFACPFALRERRDVRQEGGSFDPPSHQPRCGIEWECIRLGQERNAALPCHLHERRLGFLKRSLAESVQKPHFQRQHFTDVGRQVPPHFVDRFESTMQILIGENSSHLRGNGGVGGQIQRQ